MQITSFQYKDATFKVRAKLGRDELDHPYVLHDLITVIKDDLGVEDAEDIPIHIWPRTRWFIQMLMRTEIEDNENSLGFAWLDCFTATAQELFDLYTLLMNYDSELIIAWKAADKRSNLEEVLPND